MTTVGTIELIAKIDTKQYTQGGRTIDKTNKNIEKGANEASNNVGSSFSNAAKIATAAMVAFGVIAAKSFIDSASELQSLRASFLSLTGNVKDTNSVMSTLADLSKRTAFQNKDIQAAGRNYLAAGVSIRDLNKVLSATADVAGATGADLAQLTLPLTQTIARGKLQTQDFYQILNSGAGALRKPLTELAGKKGFGSLAEALEKSAISSDDVLKVLSQVTKKGGFAFEGALKQSKTFNGQMSNLLESITKVGLGILGVDAITGEVKIGGVFDNISKAVANATDFLTKNSGAFESLGQTLSGFGSVVAYVVGLLKPLLDYVTQNKNVMDVLKTTLTVLGVILGGTIIAAIGAAIVTVTLLTAAVDALIGTFTWLMNVGIAAWNGIVSAWNAAPKFFSGIWKSITVIFGGVDKWFGGVFGSAVRTIKNLFNSLPGFFSGLWNGIVRAFGKVGSAIGSTIGNSFKGVINGIIKFVESTINGIIRSINSVAEGIDKALPGDQSGWRVPEVSLPRLAKGGIVTSPTVAMIGEGRESEAVLPLSKLDELLNNGGGNGERGGTTVHTLIIHKDVDIDLVARKLGIEQLQTQRGIS